MNDNVVRMERRGATAVLTIDSPANRNALTPEVKDGLVRSLGAIAADREVRALVITGGGGQFCAGGDVRGMAEGANRSDAERRERMDEINRLIRQLIVLDRPVIAAVDGAAYGAGFSMALAADIVIATPRARFCLPFLKIGLVPDCGASYTLPRVVGAQRARELALSAREVRAPEALELGVVMELHEPDRLLPRALELAASFENASPTAVRLLKRNLGDVAALDAALEAEASAQVQALGTPEHREAVRRFLDKRPPAFQFPARTP